ncbi:MAG: DUF4387 domain-containing protein [Burkholderiales bacterium]
MKTLSQVAKVIRSKNAGPFMTTIDIMFATEREYQDIRDRNIINEDSVTELYGLRKGELVGIFYADLCMSIKVTLISRIPSGDFGNVDIYGAQQYIPFLGLSVE